VNTHPDFEPHRRIAASTGFRSVQSTPLLNQNSGNPVGMLSTHFREPDRRSENELRLTDFYTRQAADVITFRLAEHRLRESEARLQAAVDLLKLKGYGWNPQTNELQWDDTLGVMWGLPAGGGPCVHPNDFAQTSLIIGLFGLIESPVCLNDDHFAIAEALQRVDGETAATIMVAHLSRIEGELDLRARDEPKFDLYAVLTRWPEEGH
jgi:PAS domain-containing protein